MLVRGGSSAYPEGWPSCMDRRREVRKMWQEHAEQRDKETRHEDGGHDKK